MLRLLLLRKMGILKVSNVWIDSLSPEVRSPFHSPIHPTKADRTSDALAKNGYSYKKLTDFSNI